MRQNEGTGGFGSLRPEVLDHLRNSGLGERLAADLQRALEQYGMTMLQGQLLELAAKLAEPALQGPIDDDEASRKHVARSRKNSFNEAIDELEIGISRLPGSSSLVDDLHRARHRRNALAHEFWLSALPAVLASDIGDVLKQLERDQETFDGLMQRLFAVALGPGVTRRGIGTTEFTDAMSVIALLVVFQPSRIQGLHLIDDGDAVLERLREFITDIE